MIKGVLILIGLFFIVISLILGFKIMIDSVNITDEYWQEYWEERDDD